MVARPRLNRCSSVTRVEVRLSRQGYSLFLCAEGRWSPLRDGRRLRIWSDLDRAVVFLVERYGVLPICLRLRRRRQKEG